MDHRRCLTQSFTNDDRVWLGVHGDDQRFLVTSSDAVTPLIQGSEKGLKQPKRSRLEGWRDVDVEMGRPLFARRAIARSTANPPDFPRAHEEWMRDSETLGDINPLRRRGFLSDECPYTFEIGGHCRGSSCRGADRDIGGLMHKEL